MNTKNMFDPATNMFDPATYMFDPATKNMIGIVDEEHVRSSDEEHVRPSKNILPPSENILPPSKNFLPPSENIYLPPTGTPVDADCQRGPRRPPARTSFGEDYADKDRSSDGPIRLTSSPSRSRQCAADATAARRIPDDERPNSPGGGWRNLDDERRTSRTAGRGSVDGERIDRPSSRFRQELGSQSSPRLRQWEKFQQATAVRRTKANTYSASTYNNATAYNYNATAPNSSPPSSVDCVDDPAELPRVFPAELSPGYVVREWLREEAERDADGEPEPRRRGPFAALTMAPPVVRVSLPISHTQFFQDFKERAEYFRAYSFDPALLGLLKVDTIGEKARREANKVADKFAKYHEFESELARLARYSYPGLLTEIMSQRYSVEAFRQGFRSKWTAPYCWSQTQRQIMDSLDEVHYREQPPRFGTRSFLNITKPLPAQLMEKFIGEVQDNNRHLEDPVGKVTLLHLLAWIEEKAAAAKRLGDNYFYSTDKGCPHHQSDLPTDHSEPEGHMIDPTFGAEYQQRDPLGRAIVPTAKAGKGGGVCGIPTHRKLDHAAYLNLLAVATYASGKLPEENTCTHCNRVHHIFSVGTVVVCPDKMALECRKNDNQAMPPRGGCPMRAAPDGIGAVFRAVLTKLKMGHRTIFQEPDGEAQTAISDYIKTVGLFDATFDIVHKARIAACDSTHGNRLHNALRAAGEDMDEYGFLLKPVQGGAKRTLQQTS